MARLSGEPSAEEPDASIAHVRICGGPGRATSSAYPTHGRHAGPGNRRLAPATATGWGPGTTDESTATDWTVRSKKSRARRRVGVGAFRVADTDGAPE